LTFGRDGLAPASVCFISSKAGGRVVATFFIHVMCTERFAPRTDTMTPMDPFVSIYEGRIEDPMQAVYIALLVFFIWVVVGAMTGQGPWRHQTKKP